MLTDEQKRQLGRLEGSDKLLSAVFDDIKESLLIEIGKTEPNESKQREWNYQQAKIIDKVKERLTGAFLFYKNSN